MMEQKDMLKLVGLLREDMQPALGVTEPGAIALAVAEAASHVTGPLASVHVAMNSGMYKNAFTCGIPNSDQVGNVFAAALGVVAGDPAKGLEALAGVTPDDNVKAQALIDAGKVSVSVSEITPRIFIQADVKTDTDQCRVTIVDKHTNIVEIILNGKTLYKKDGAEGAAEAAQEEGALIHGYTLAGLCEFVDSVPLADLEFIRQAYVVNYDLFEEGLHSPRTTFAKSLYQQNHEQVISDDEVATAQLLCNAAIEARVIGLDEPAMSITGSGAHGIICTMPLYGVCKIHALPEEKLLRATALSYLVTMYIKEYSGRLSAFCGCAIAAGTGMACALVYLKGGGLAAMVRTINNMAASITGMICDGGNQGCTMKGIVAVDAAFRSVRFALEGVCIDDVHGIIGATPEQTMHNMSLIASQGMVGTEKTLIDILKMKMEH